MRRCFSIYRCLCDCWLVSWLFRSAYQRTNGDLSAFVICMMILVCRMLCASSAFWRATISNAYTTRYIYIYIPLSLPPVSVRTGLIFCVLSCSLSLFSDCSLLHRFFAIFILLILLWQVRADAFTLFRSKIVGEHTAEFEAELTKFVTDYYDNAKRANRDKSRYKARVGVAFLRC